MKSETNIRITGKSKSGITLESVLVPFNESLFSVIGYLYKWWRKTGNYSKRIIDFQVYKDDDSDVKEFYEKDTLGLHDIPVVDEDGYIKPNDSKMVFVLLYKKPGTIEEEKFDDFDDACENMNMRIREGYQITLYTEEMTETEWNNYRHERYMLERNRSLQEME